MVPMNTNKVPNQCTVVNGFWKYQIDSINEVNLRRVTAKVTVRLLHSDDNIKADIEHT